jgi:hypothetical protein
MTNLRFQQTNCILLFVKLTLSNTKQEDSIDTCVEHAGFEREDGLAVILLAALSVGFVF